MRSPLPWSNRRSFLAMTGVSSAALALGTGHAAADELDGVGVPADPFTLGVATNLWRRGVPMPPAEHNATTITLEQYRLRYSLFRTDPHLQAIHAAAPWVATTDDHEVENNYADELSLENGTPPGDFLRRRAVAYRAFYENLPVRSAPHGPDLPVYRRLRWGRLADVDVLDNRQYRDGYPAGAVTDNSPERHHPRRSILGKPQESWLYEGLRRSDATWNLFAQGVVMAQIDRDTGAGQLYSNDQWDGFPAARDRLFAAWRQHRIANPVVLTGDIHRHVAAELKADWSDPASATVGVELVGSSIASDGDGAETDNLAAIWLGNPHVKLYNARPGRPASVTKRAVVMMGAPGELGARARTWYYRVVVVDAAGSRSRPSAEFSAASAESVTVAGRPLATLGSFDRKRRASSSPSLRPGTRSTRRGSPRTSTPPWAPTRRRTGPTSTRARWTPGRGAGHIDSPSGSHSRQCRTASRGWRCG
jgi:hypothetical protein